MFTPPTFLLKAPDSISQYFTNNFNHTEALSPAETKLIAHAVPKRIADFTTGRHCAKQALSKITKQKIEILQGANREPLWPANIVGSISHSAKMAGAIVAWRDEIEAIGIDIETLGGVKPGMWDMIFTDAEQENLKNKDDRSFWATLFFSFKESFYKMQYPQTNLFLEFKDIMICEKDNEVCFSQATTQHDLSAINLDDVKTQWAIYEDQLITLCYIPNKLTY